MKFIYSLFFLVFLSSNLFSQTTELSSIKIARDKWGVPHIYAPTDKEVAYGLAWAQCEDDFKTLQEQMLAVHGKYGEVKGMDGILVDFGIKFMGLREVVEARYEKDLSPEFRELLSYSVDAVNSYAALHPREVLLKKLFPLNGHDIVIGYLLGMVGLSGAQKDLEGIMSGKFVDDSPPKGSNAFAFSSKRTKEGHTYLVINSHQPLEGWYSWYEAHLISDEGWNILGGTFPGGVSIFHGANENLGWAHTVNHADFSDVYRLTINPKNKNQYRLDGKWLNLNKRKYKSKLKLGFLKIPISRKVYESEFGVTFRTKNGTFAWRYTAQTDIRAIEQWYRMNKAQNFEEFRELLNWRAIVSNNLVYADREDNIYYLSNGRVPIRNPNYNWRGVLPGDTSATIWTEYHPISDLPQVLNPESGYVWNTNNTPFNSTSPYENPVENHLNKTMGFQSVGIENNRSTRFMELMALYDKISYEDLKKIKYDDQFPNVLRHPKITNLDLLMNLDAEKYPNITDAINHLNKWDRRSNVENNYAAFPIIVIDYLFKDLRKSKRNNFNGKITETDCVNAIQKAKTQMLADFGKLEIPLGDFQKHVRGDVSLPLGGAPDVLRAMYGKRQDDGTYKGIAGECFIELVQFTPEGVILETVNAYGTSAKPDSPHYTDQMEMFTKKELKSMSLDKEKVFREAVRVYSPMKVIN